jgi:[ribosomal protein S18]-alanine N-acetyltransferase
MTPADPALLARLHAQAFAAPWSEAEFADLLGQAGVFAVVEPDGFILVRVVLDEAEILTLAVRPEARRAGLGGRLTGRGAVAAAQAGASRLFLEVAEDNVAARALYDRAGFRPDRPSQGLLRRAGRGTDRRPGPESRPRGRS